MEIELKSDNDGKPVLHQNVGKFWCNCGRRRQFVHQSSGHVKTTDLCIVTNRELRRLFTKGTGFRLKSFFQDGDHQNSRWEIQRALKALRMAVKSFCDRMKGNWAHLGDFSPMADRSIREPRAASTCCGYGRGCQRGASANSEDHRPAPGTNGFSH